jgi:effector-binding domain-containing protein
MAEVQVKDVKAMTVVSLPFTGSYEQTQEKLDELMSWLLRAGHPAAGAPMGLYYDDPAKVAPDDLRAEVCVPIEESCEPTEDVRRKELPAVRVASAMHQGPYHEVPSLYEQIFEWMRENGLQYDGTMPTREVFRKLHGEVKDAAEYITEVQVPLLGA